MPPVVKLMDDLMKMDPVSQQADGKLRAPLPRRFVLDRKTGGMGKLWPENTNSM
jgi:hypothetical protein